MPLDAVHPELGLGVVGRVRQPGHGVGAAHLAVDRLHAPRGGVGGLGVAEGGGGHVVGGAPQAVQRAVAVVAVLGDAGHRQRVQRLNDQRAQAADEADLVAHDLPGHRARVRADPCVVSARSFIAWKPYPAGYDRRGMRIFGSRSPGHRRLRRAGRRDRARAGRARGGARAERPSQGGAGGAARRARRPSAAGAGRPGGAGSRRRPGRARRPDRLARGQRRAARQRAARRASAPRRSTGPSGVNLTVPDSARTGAGARDARAGRGPPGVHRLAQRPRGHGGLVALLGHQVRPARAGRGAARRPARHRCGRERRLAELRLRRGHVRRHRREAASRASAPSPPRRWAGGGYRRGETTRPRSTWRRWRCAWAPGRLRAGPRAHGGASARAGLAKDRGTRWPAPSPASVNWGSVPRELVLARGRAELLALRGEVRVERVLFEVERDADDARLLALVGRGVALAR